MVGSHKAPNVTHFSLFLVVGEEHFYRILSSFRPGWLNQWPVDTGHCLQTPRGSVIQAPVRRATGDPPHRGAPTSHQTLSNCLQTPFSRDTN